MSKPIKSKREIIEPNFWKKLWLILERKEKLQLFGILILQVIGSFVEVVGLGAIPAFILALANPSKILNHKIAGPFLGKLSITGTEQLLIWGAVALITLFIVKNLYLFMTGIIRANYLRNLQVKYGLEIFQKYMYADYTYLLSHNTAELLRNCVTEVSQVVIGILQGILNLFMDILLILNMSIVLFVIEPLITLITIVVIGSIALVFLKVTRAKLERLGKKAQLARKGLVLAVNQGLHGIKETRIMHAEDYFIEAYKTALSQMARSAKLLTVISSTIKPLFETLAVAALLLISVLMYFQNKSMASVIPVLSVFSIAMIRLLPAIREITSTVSTLRYSFYSINPIYESRFISGLPMVYSQESSSDVVSELPDIVFDECIELKNISYSYPNTEHAAVDNVSFKVSKGEVVAFVGSSGAGKTTLVDIITGLLHPNSGEILVDGNDVTLLMRSWQRHLGYIPQFIYLADSSLKNNVIWGHTKKINHKAAFQIAIKAAQLEELISQLPDGINTVIGERGTRLSGGQRQRIGIARAIYRNPDVLIMDEATAALDNITEQEITAAIDQMKGSRTMIIIAHRLSTVRSSDRLYLMERGQIIASGSYDKLLDTSPEFRALHKAMEKH